MGGPPRFEEILANDWPVEPDVKVLVAVSGGPDSVALLRGLLRIGQPRNLLTVVHVNHGVRSDSDSDEEFVRQLCQSVDVTVHVHRVSGGEIQELQSGQGFEAAARSIRYRILRSHAEQIGARFIVTGHNADDQAETVLHNICRGTGLNGLCGIPRLRALSEAVVLIRPMLKITRNQIEQYLRDIQQHYVIDPTNLESDFTRNQIRNQVLPLLENVNHGVQNHLRQLALHCQELKKELDRWLERLDVSVVAESPKSIQINIDNLRGQSPFLIAQFLLELWRRNSWPLQAMDHSKWCKIAEAVIRSESVFRMSLPKQIDVQIIDGVLAFHRRPF